MLNRNEIEQAIAELENAPTTFSNCQKLATLYTVRKEAFGDEPPENRERFSYSFASAPMKTEEVTAIGDSEFMQAVYGKDLQSVYDILDDLMDNLKVISPKAYDRIMRRLRDL